jgi:LPPG:FO 2-phospho-L-lactate transferase
VITVLAGGVGAARFLVGLTRTVDPESVTAVVNTADDTRLHGLALSPDLDTVTYTLAGAVDPERGWGLAGETWAAMEALDRYGAARPAGSSAGQTWFRLGDRDLATHLYRTARLAEGAPLSAVVAEVATAWGVRIRVLPVTDDPLATMVTVADEGEITFQDYFVRRRHDVAITALRFAGAATARPAPGVLAAVDDADTVVIAPSNPLVSIGPILAVDAVRTAVAARRDDVVAVSPIVGGVAVRGPADRMLRELGHEATVVGVARLYAGVAATLVIDVADAALAPAVEAARLRCVVTDTVMRAPDIAAALARTTIASARP